MVITWRDLLAAALTAAIASSCSTSPPGAGFTSGDKGTFTADEKPAVRDDLQMPTNTGSGDAPLADSAALNPATSVDNSGNGAKSASSNAAPAQEQPASSDAASNPPATPPKIESSNAGGAQGGTKPADDIKVGTPKSPQ